MLDFVTLVYDAGFQAWVPEGVTEDHEGLAQRMVFQDAARLSKLRWEALDIMQRYCFKIIGTQETLGLRFLGVEARWGEYVAATKDQMVLGNPS